MTPLPGFRNEKAQKWLGLLTGTQELVSMTALLLADSGYAPLNPLEWIERWGSQVALLSVAGGMRREDLIRK